MWPKWEKVLSLQLHRDSALTDQSGKCDMSRARRKYNMLTIDALDSAACKALRTVWILSASFAEFKASSH